MRLAFTKVLDRTYLLDTDVNSMFSDIGTYINAKLALDVFESSCVEYRHLSEPPVFFLADKDVGISEIGAPVPGAGWQILNTNVKFEPTYNTQNSIFVEVWFYGYEHTSTTRIGISKYDGAAFVFEGETRNSIGYGRNDPNSWAQYAIVGSAGGLQKHYHTGVVDWVPKSAGMFCVMTNAVFGPNGISAAFGFERYNVMMLIDAVGKTVGDFDKCYMFACAKDVT